MSRFTRRLAKERVWYVTVYMTNHPPMTEGGEWTRAEARKYARSVQSSSNVVTALVRTDVALRPL